MIKTDNATRKAEEEKSVKENKRYEKSQKKQPPYEELKRMRKRGVVGVKNAGWWWSGRISLRWWSTPIAAIRYSLVLFGIR